MAKRAVAAEEMYYDDTDGGLYQLRPDGTYEEVSIGGAKRVRVAATDVSFPEAWKYQDGVSAKTAAALFTTADVSGFCPFDTLTFTKSAAVESATVTLQMRSGSRGVVVISGLTAETVAITGTINGVATGNVMGRISGALNTVAPMTGLGNGTHFLEF